MTAGDDACGDGRDLGRSFAYAEDHLGEALSQGAVMIDAREAEVLERRRLERSGNPGRGRVGIDLAIAHAIEELPEFGDGHNSFKLGHFR
jgi:hypothetical protein